MVNKVRINGEVVGRPELSHEAYGQNFYEFYVVVKRMSQNEDIIPVIVSERKIDISTLMAGAVVDIIGSFRSRNCPMDNKSKHKLFVFVEDIEVTNVLTNENLIEVSGCICKAPVFRITPKEREICDVFIGSNRDFNKSDYIPGICWGLSAMSAKSLNVGQEILLLGRIQSREYVKKFEDGTEENRVAYEVSAQSFELVEGEE